MPIETATPNSPAINPLIPDGIENFIPSCVVCRKPVPRKRATGRSKNTCSPECNTVLRKFRKHVVDSSYCPTCYHPSTPQERREMILWRKHRGDLREGRGRPPRSQDEKLRLALQEAIGLLRGENEEQGGNLTRLMEPIERFEKLVDSKSVNQDTLAASGISA
jgi:hypothetical protein